MNDAKRQNVHLQEQLKQSCDDLALLRGNCSELIYSNQQKDIQISEMKHEIERNTKLFQERESFLATTNDLLKKQFKDAVYELETSKQVIKRENNQSNIKITKLGSEIKCLHLMINEKESELLRLGVEFAKQVELNEKEENKLLDLKSKHFKQIIDLEKELEKQNVKMFALEQVTKQNNQLKQALVKSHENGVAVCKNVEELTLKLNEKDKHISELTQQLKTASESLENMKSEFVNIEHSSDKKVDSETDHNQLENTQEKEQLTKNKMQIVSTRKHIDCEMENKEPVQNRKETQHALIKSAETEGALRKSINELQIICHSLKMERKKAEEKLRQCEQEMEHEKEQLHIMKFQMCKEIEGLKKELTMKEAALQEIHVQYEDSLKLHEETEVKLNGIIIHKDIQIKKFSEDIKKKDLENKETECQIAELKCQLKETEQDQYKQDIANAKQLSKAAQIKMSEIDTSINDLTNTLKSKEEELQTGEENLGGIIDSQKEQIRHLEREVQNQERKMKSVERDKYNKLQKMEKNMVELGNHMKHMLSKLRDTETELDETKSRLSCVMEDKLTDSSINITDLSDRNRPTKIAEKCAELYENEWTYAFDVLEKLFRTEQAAIEAFLLILQNTMHFCKTMARRQIEIIERELYFADETDEIAFSSSYIQKIIKDRRKATAVDAVTNLKKIYVAQLKKSKDKIMRAALDVEPYTSECIEICWLMLIQDPQVVFAPLPIKDSSFDTNFYKPYTTSGTYVDFAVWPALLLHDGGPILAKGVAQGYENN